MHRIVHDLRANRRRWRNRVDCRDHESMGLAISAKPIPHNLWICASALQFFPDACTDEYLIMRQTLLSSSLLY